MAHMHVVASEACPGDTLGYMRLVVGGNKLTQLLSLLDIDLDGHTTNCAPSSLPLYMASNESLIHLPRAIRCAAFQCAAVTAFCAQNAAVSISLKSICLEQANLGLVAAGGHVAGSCQDTATTLALNLGRVPEQVMLVVTDVKDP